MLIFMFVLYKVVVVHLVEYKKNIKYLPFILMCKYIDIILYVLWLIN